MHSNRKQGILVGFATDIDLLRVGPNFWIVVEVSHGDPDLVSRANLERLSFGIGSCSIYSSDTRNTRDLFLHSQLLSNRRHGKGSHLPVDQVFVLPRST